MNYNCKTQKVIFVDTLQSFRVDLGKWRVENKVRDKATERRKRREVKERKGEESMVC